MSNFDEIRERVTANNDVLTLRMEELRDAFGVRRLGPHVCDEISQKLKGVGLGHTPELEPDGWLNVRLYRLGTPVAAVIAAVENPGADGDNRLRELGTNEPAQVIDQIRALVCA